MKERETPRTNARQAGGRMKDWATYLASDAELAYLKRALAAIEEATRILKGANDEARARNTPIAHPFRNLTLRECYWPWTRKDYDREW